MIEHRNEQEAQYSTHAQSTVKAESLDQRPENDVEGVGNWIWRELNKNLASESMSHFSRVIHDGIINLSQIWDRFGNLIQTSNLC